MGRVDARHTVLASPTTTFEDEAEAASDSVGWPLIIRLIIQTILLYPSGAVCTEEAPNVSRLDPSGAVQSDAEHPSRNRKA